MGGSLHSNRDPGHLFPNARLFELFNLSSVAQFGALNNKHKIDNNKVIVLIASNYKCLPVIAITVDVVGRSLR